MKKTLKWTLVVIGALVVVAFFAFLYLIPPFTLAPPEDFIRPEREAPPSLAGINDPAERILAERGKTIAMIAGCTGCHTPGGSSGPVWTKYLAGGFKISVQGYGTVVSRNLTPDSATGLGRKADEQVLRVLRSGVLSDGRIAYPYMMPWIDFSNLTEEDRYAVLTFLRNIKPVLHRIPAWSPESPSANEQIWGGQDYALPDAGK